MITTKLETKKNSDFSWILHFCAAIHSGLLLRTILRKHLNLGGPRDRGPSTIEYR